MMENKKVPYLIEFCLLYGDHNKINWGKVEAAYGREKTEEIKQKNKSYYWS